MDGAYMKKYLWGLRSLALGAVTAGIALAGLPATSSAALISGGACDNSTLSQPFAHYGDSNEYKLVSGGNFEGSLSGWTLSGGARVINGGNVRDTRRAECGDPRTGDGHRPRSRRAVHRRRNSRSRLGR